MSNYTVYIPESILCGLLQEEPIRAARSYKHQQGKLNEPSKLRKSTKKQSSTRISR